MWSDYIKILGYDGTPSEGADPGTFEVFQGIGGGSGGGTGGGDQPYEPVDLEKLQEWLDAVESWVDDEERWIDAVIAYTSGTRDVPAPMPPELPDLTDFVSLPSLIGQFGPWGVVIWVGLKIIRRVLEAWLEKKLNPSFDDLKSVLEEIRDSIKKGLLYNGVDSTLKKAFLFDNDLVDTNNSVFDVGLLFTDKDEKRKGVFNRAFLYKNKLEDVVSYLAALPDLAYVDAVVDFGAFRCHLKGKMIEY